MVEQVTLTCFVLVQPRKTGKHPNMTKQLSAFYVCCIYSCAVQTRFYHGSKHYEPLPDLGPYCLQYSTGLDNKKIQRKIVYIFLPIIFSICFGCSKEPSVLGAQKNRLIEMVLLSTTNNCFG